MDAQRELTDAESDLLATAENIHADAEELQSIERAKESLPAEDDRVVPLAKQAKGLAEEIAAKASQELELAKEVTEKR